MSDSDSDLQQRLNVEVPHSARIWNYLLGGKDNFESDRAAADAVLAQMPDIRTFAVAGREFLARAITFLTREAGIRQFLDIGTGLPTANNTHDLAQGIAPSSKIVYVDNDPLVLVHARALLTSHPDGTTSYIDADVREPEKVLQAAADTLDFAQPIAVVMIGILGHVPDSDDPAGIVRTIVDALPSGSYLVINDSITTPVNDSAVETAQSKGANYHLRSIEQITAFFDGLELVEPGVISTPLWRPSSDSTPQEIAVYCGVARKA
jgi:hypothetical protein